MQCHTQRKRTQGHRVPSINGTDNVFIYLFTLAKQKNKEQTKKNNNKAKGKQNEETNDENKQTITRTNRTKTKYGGSCIQSNRFVSLIKDIVASIIILVAITFNNEDPYRCSVHKDFES